MKRAMKRLGAVIISLAILVSLTPMTGVTVFADETETSAATSSTETKQPDQGKPKEPKKPAETTKETKKPAETTKETEKPAETTKETEKPAETTKETEKPAETTKETEKPAETIKETEKPSEKTTKETEKPSEDTTKETEKPETDEPKETEKPAPEESKGQEPSESVDPKETEPSETEPETPETSEAPEETVPSESEVTTTPDESTVSKDKKSAALTGVQLSENGILTWTRSDEIPFLQIYINDYIVREWYNGDEDPPRLDLKKEIDYWIKTGDVTKSSPYKIKVCAVDENWDPLDEWSALYTYNSESEPIVEGTITNVKCTNGTLTWDKFTGTSYYSVGGDYFDREETETNSFNIGTIIDRKIKNREIDKAEDGSYNVMIEAYDRDNLILAVWDGNITYQTSVTPIEIGEIKGVSFNSGTMTWTPYEGAVHYSISIDGIGDADTETNSFKIEDKIDYLIKSGYIDKSSSYTIELTAYDSDEAEIANWSGEHSYNSTAEPVVVGEITGVSCSIDGMLTWNKFNGAARYAVDIECFGDTSVESNSYNLGKEIDRMIKCGDIRNEDKYYIIIAAYNEEGIVIAIWKGLIYYHSSATFIDPGEIKGVTFNSGTMTWTPYEGTAQYRVSVADYVEIIDTNTYKIDDEIDKLIRDGLIEKSSPYRVEITAYDSDDIEIANWSGDYSYNSTAELVVVGEITGVSCSIDGMLTWNEFTGASYYRVEVEGNESVEIYDNQYDVGKEIDRQIKVGEIANKDYYYVKITAYDEDDIPIALWEDGIDDYKSSATPVVVGEIKNAKCYADGMIIWNEFTGASYYRVIYEGNESDEIYDNQYDVGKDIDRGIKVGYIFKNNSGLYNVGICAYDDDDAVIAKWEGKITYNSSASLIVKGEIQNIKFNNGMMTWDAYSGSDKDHYWIGISDSDDGYMSYEVQDNKFAIRDEITKAIADGDLNNESSYFVEVTADDSDCLTLAEGTATYYHNATPLKSISGAKVTGISNKTYTGNEITLTVGVTLSGKKLVEETDFTVSYADNINVGKAKVTITGIGNYKDTISKTFTISQASITGATVTGISDKTYTGSAIEQDFAVNVNGNVLIKGTDYSVGYKYNTKVGKATVTITGKGNYKGTVSKTFMIVKADIGSGTVTGFTEKTYTGKAITQQYDLTVDGRVLKETTDYTVAYSDNTNAGTATVMFVGKGNYTGTLNATFKINPASLEAAVITGIEDKGYTGSAITQNPVVTLDGKTLKADSDYTVSYSGNTAIGTATVTIKGIGNYAGEITKTFEIREPIDLSGATVSAIEAKGYTGKAIEPELTVTLDGSTLVKGKDYTVSYEDNVALGTAKFTITGTDLYTGTINGSFEIVQGTNTLRVKGKTAKIKYKRKKQTVKASKLYYYYSKGQGALSFKKIKGSSKFSVNSKTGNVSVKKKTKKGTYKIKVRIKAAGNTNYLPSEYKTITVTIKVKR